MEGRNINVKISLKEIAHKIIRNKTECKFIITFGLNKR